MRVGATAREGARPLGEEEVALAPWTPGRGLLPAPAFCTAQTGGCRQPEAGALLGATTHFRAQRILGRVVTTQVGCSVLLTSLCREGGSKGDSADSRGTAVGCGLSAGRCDTWGRHGPGFQLLRANRIKEWQRGLCFLPKIITTSKVCLQSLVKVLLCQF